MSQAAAESNRNFDAVLLASFGGPEGQDDVIPFLRNVVAGRGIPDERLEEVAVHYRTNGGISPITEQNRQLLGALRTELAARGLELPIYWGNRNWMPYIPATLRQMYDAGHRRVLMLVTSAYAGYSSCTQYREDIDAALVAEGLVGKLEVVKVRQFFYDSTFITPFAQGLAAGITDVRAQIAAAGKTGEPKIVFVTHSIPTAVADAQGPASVAVEYGTDVYTAQHLAVARALMSQVPEAAGLEHSLVFQSRSGSPHTPWLEPDINDALEEDAAAGVPGVVVMPIGFVSDHMEVLWDLDTEAKDTCASLGLGFHRAPTPAINPVFVGGLVDTLGEYVDGATHSQVAQLVPGSWEEICTQGCCQSFLAEHPMKQIEQDLPL